MSYILVFLYRFILQLLYIFVNCNKCFISRIKPSINCRPWFTTIYSTNKFHMDRLLKPQILNADPGDLLAYKHYKHWIKTFTSFADTVEQSLRLPAAEQNADAPDRVVDKLALLHCYLSPEIFDLIEESANYDEAKTILD